MKGRTREEQRGRGGEEQQEGSVGRGIGGGAGAEAGVKDDKLKRRSRRKVGSSN